MYVFYHRVKKRSLCTSVLQCRMLQCQTWEDKAWSENPVPRLGSQPSHVLLWERQNLAFMSGLRVWKMQLGGHFEWNAAVKSQFTFQAQGCSKTISLYLGSSTWNSPLKTDIPLLLCQSFKVCVWVCVCMCESEFWDERNKRRWVTQLSSLSLSF